MNTSLKQYYTNIRSRWIKQGDCIKESNWHEIMRADLLIQACKGMWEINLPGIPTKPPTVNNTPHTPQLQSYTERRHKTCRSQKKAPPPLNAKVKVRFQKVVGSFLYYGRAVDMTISASLSKITGEQSNPTENTIKMPTNSSITWQQIRRFGVKRCATSLEIFHKDGAKTKK